MIMHQRVIVIPFRRINFKPRMNTLIIFSLVVYYRMLQDPRRRVFHPLPVLFKGSDCCPASDALPHRPKLPRQILLDQIIIMVSPKQNKTLSELPFQFLDDLQHFP